MPHLSKFITASFIVFLFIGFSVHAKTPTFKCVALGDESTEIKQNNLELLLIGNCKHVSVSGHGNEITTKNITSLTLLGDSNKVKVDSVEFVTGRGKNNIIKAKKIILLVVDGNGNSIDVLNINKILMGGKNNTVNYGGAEPEHKLRGHNNKLVSIDNPLVADAKPKPARKPAKKAAPPRVNLTGKFLNSLPAGYRMHVKTTNYWTNRAMTATRSIYLKLTRDGQFEVSSSSISGGGPGSVVVATASNKKGSTGSVGGAGGVSLHTRKGVDPSKYGTYYISGKQIEMRFANGKLVRSSFKTDGKEELVIGDKRYFVD